jgi:hypothetical protein
LPKSGAGREGGLADKHLIFFELLRIGDLGAGKDTSHPIV